MWIQSQMANVNGYLNPVNCNGLYGLNAPGHIVRRLQHNSATGLSGLGDDTTGTSTNTFDFTSFLTGSSVWLVVALGFVGYQLLAGGETKEYRSKLSGARKEYQSKVKKIKGEYGIARRIVGSGARKPATAAEES